MFSSLQALTSNSNPGIRARSYIEPSPKALRSVCAGGRDARHASIPPVVVPRSGTLLASEEPPRNRLGGSASREEINPYKWRV